MRFKIADYAECIEENRSIDLNFYKAQRPRNLAAQINPIAHYILWGESQGLWPNANFSPAAYLANNCGHADEIKQPLWHYLERGRNLGFNPIPLPPTTAPVDPMTLPADLEALPFLVGPASKRTTGRLAVVAHVFHYDLWPEIAAALTFLPEPFDLYCTVIKREGFDQLEQDIQDKFRGAQVLCYPNHGRDIFPFVHLVNSGRLFNYAAICKLHTKRSCHLPHGDQWRNELIQGLLPGNESTHSLLDAFLGDPSLGAWVSDGQLLRHRHFWGPNRERVEHELARIGIKANRYELKFPGGSMFWIKPAALHLLKGMDYNALDFEREEGQLDGTLAHAIERIIGFLVQHSGQRLVERADLLGAKSSANSI
jgi:lipopolysaccharide biosynthesis protein